MPRSTTTPVRTRVKRRQKKLCIIATEDSATGAYRYLCELKNRFGDEFVVEPSEILPSKDGKTKPLDVYKRLLRYGYDPSYDTYWVVSDVDSWGEHKLDQLSLACSRMRGFRTAISNNCFEIWLLYHQQGYNGDFVTSAACKAAGERFVHDIGGHDALFEGGRLDFAILKAKAMDSEGHNWPRSQGSHLYKLLEYLRNG